MDDSRSVSLGRYYDLMVRYTSVSGGVYIEVGWYKKADNSSSYNSQDARGSVTIDGRVVYNPTRIDFDMRSNSVGDFKAFYTTTVYGKAVHVVAYFDANMSSGNVTSGTVDWEIAIQRGGVVMLCATVNGSFRYRRYRPYICTGGRYVPASLYVCTGGRYKQTS